MNQKFIRTISELQTFLDENAWSPERLSQHIKISNMTIRRLLQKNPTSRIPEKYYAVLDQLTLSLSTAGDSTNSDIEKDFGHLVAYLEKNGREFGDIESLPSKVEEKLAEPSMFESIRRLARKLLDTVSDKNASFQFRAMAAGALLYLINPIDLIPDALPTVGYLDDLGVLSLVAEIIFRQQPTARKPA